MKKATNESRIQIRISVFDVGFIFMLICVLLLLQMTHYKLTNTLAVIVHVTFCFANYECNPSGQSIIWMKIYKQIMYMSHA